jgi:Fe-S-cluster containining protein
MENKNLKFLSSEKAINEVFLDLINPEKCYELALFAKVYGFLTKGSARPGKKYFKESNRDEKGVWFKAKGAKKEKFIRAFDFKDVAIDIIPKVSAKTDEIAKAYKWTMWVKASPGKGADGENGIWFETEMKKFQCVQCGNCCRNLGDAFSTSVDMDEINHWRFEDRWDILNWVHIFNFDGKEAFGDIWFSPNTGNEVSRCPWLRKLPRQDKYKCRIHDTKPAHCGNYPKSKKHALTTGCKGFESDFTFERVTRDLEKLYDTF